MIRANPTLKAFWRFTGNYLDSSGNGNNGTGYLNSGSGGDDYVPLIGSGVNFDHTDDYISCGTNDVLNFGKTTKIGISFIVRRPSNTNVGASNTTASIMNRGLASGTYPAWVVGVGTDANYDWINFFLASNYSANVLSVNFRTSKNSIWDGTQKPVVIYYPGDANANNVVCMINNVTISPTVVTNTLTNAVNCSGATMKLGKDIGWYGGSGNCALATDIDEVKLLSGITLTISDIMRLSRGRHPFAKS